jgi:hypothetical protein
VPDESDFRNFKTIEDFGKTLEGSKYYHDLYLKAVNHPIRREILLIVSQYNKISRNELLNTLISKALIIDESVFTYNIDYLLKALCLESTIDEQTRETFYQITQSGKIIDYLR